MRIKQDSAAGPEVSAPAKARRPVRGGHLPLRQRRALQVSDLPGPVEEPAAREDKAAGPASAAPRRRARPKAGPQAHPPRGGQKARQERGAGRTARDEAPRHPVRADQKRADRPQREGRPQPARKAAAGPQRFFVASPRGLEQELARELVELGTEGVEPASGGVICRGEISQAWKINLWSRLAIRVLQQVAQGHYRSEDDLYRAARELPWPEWFPVGRTIAVTTVAHRSPLKSLNFASLKIKDALCDRFRDVTGARPDVDAHAPDVPILLYLTEDSYTLYLDLTGEPLNRRGYRVQAAKAPLNENLAAGMLRLAGWTPELPLLDPMMGGGTILLEAALMALNIAPGLKRHFAFENLNSFDRVEWARLRKNAQAGQKEKRALPIYGCDIDPRMVHATETNLRAAGLLDCVTLREADALQVEAPAKTGLIVSNPPYGVRLAQEDMAAFYRGLGDNLKRHFAGWTAYLLSADPELPRHIGLKATRRTPLFNGPLECRLYEYRMVSGQMRRQRAPG